MKKLLTTLILLAAALTPMLLIGLTAKEAMQNSQDQGSFAEQMADETNETLFAQVNLVK